MTVLQALILGIVQGVTEFLPISSSGHLVLVPFLFNWQIPSDQAFSFDVLVQLGTLLAVFAYFWRDLYEIIRCFLIALSHRRPFESPEARLGWYLIISAIPASIVGLLFKSQIELAFASPGMVAVFLFVTALLLVVAERFGQRRRELVQMNWLDAVWIGAAQVLSLFPGVSRSGSTIAGGMTRNLERQSAGRFAFLMSIPVMLGAGLVSSLDLIGMPNLSSFLPVLAVGFLTAAVVGYLSIAWLLSYLNRHSLIPFAVYCSVLAVVILVLYYVA